MNPAAESLLRCKKEDFLGSDLPCVIEAKLPDGSGERHALNPVAEVLKTGAALNVQSATIIRPDGTAFPARLTASPIVTGAKVTGVVVTFHDNTERQNLEQELRQLQKMEAIGQLAGGVAHDFNNLLTIINGHASLLLAESSATERVKRLAQPIRAAGERAAQLTQRLLAFSRRQMLEPKVVSINAVVTDIEPIIQRLLPEDISVRMRLDPAAGQITVDPGQLEQIILNLAVNARDAMSSGGQLIFETRRTEIARAFPDGHRLSPGCYTVLSVSDTGVGMAASTKAHIFEPFFTTKDPGLGTGLGLSVVYGVVRQSGGHISVYSEPGMGTCFNIYFPSTATEPAPAPVHNSPRTDQAGSETVLLVEDDAGVREYVQAVLEGFGYRVLTFGDPDAAVAFGENCPEHIDVLLTDVVMPGRNGSEVASALRKKRPDLRVLYMSGYTSDVIVRQGVLSPEHAFLSKPFAPEALNEKIRRVLQTASHQPVIVVVHEEASLQELLSEFLGWAGYKIVQATTGEEVLSECLRRGADLVVADVTNPEGAGHRAIRMLRQESLRTPVIAVSSDAIHDARCPDCLGASAVFLKTLEIEELLNTTRALLNNRPAESSIPLAT